MQEKLRLTGRHLRTTRHVLGKVTRPSRTIHKDMDMLIIICTTKGLQPIIHITTDLMNRTTTLRLGTNCRQIDRTLYTMSDHNSTVAHTAHPITVYTLSMARILRT